MRESFLEMVFSGGTLCGFVCLFCWRNDAYQEFFVSMVFRMDVVLFSVGSGFLLATAGVQAWDSMRK